MHDPYNQIPFFMKPSEFNSGIQNLPVNLYTKKSVIDLPGQKSILKVMDHNFLSLFAFWQQFTQNTTTLGSLMHFL